MGPVGRVLLWVHSGISGLSVSAVAARNGIFRHFLRACSPMAQLV